jgi:hypothetical protein
MSWLGDTLAVFDGRNYRFSLFDANGTFLRSVSPRVDIGRAASPMGASGYPARPSTLLGDGTVLAVTPGFSQEIVSGQLTRIAYVRTSVEGVEIDTLVTLPVGRSSVLGVLRDGGGTYTNQPFSDAVLGVVTQDAAGFLVLERPAPETPDLSEFRLTRLDLAGDTVFSRSYPFQPQPLPRERIDSVVDAVASRLHGFVGERTGTTMGQWLDWVREATYAPAFYSPVDNLLPGADGTIWISLTPTSAAPPQWLVLTEEGEPLFLASTPAGMRLLYANRDFLWGTEKDELEVEYIVRYRIVR